MLNPSPDETADGQPSRTALITCLMRALHTRYDRPALIHDDWGEKLVTRAERDAMAAVLLGATEPADVERFAASGKSDELLHTAWSPLSVYGGVIIRTRYAEERVAAAVARGIRQYVILGAGFDSFGMRQPGDSPLTVFEVDHPASQAMKRRRIEAAGATIPSNLQFVAADLARETLDDALARSAFRFDEPAVFSWLGVTVYLTHDANAATLRSIARVGAPGSELVFTYVEQSALDSQSPGMRKAKAFAASLGEPWLSGFRSATLGRELAKLGLTLVEDLGAAEMQSRYCQGRTDPITPGRAGRIALARV